MGTSGTEVGADDREIRTAFERFVASARRLVESVERGRSETPMSRLVAGLRAADVSDPVHLLLVSLDPSDRAALLERAADLPVGSLDGVRLDSTEMVRVEFGGGDFEIAHPGRADAHADDIEGFALQLRDAGAAAWRSGEGSVVRWRVPEKQDRAPVVVWSPASLAALRGVPGLLDIVARECTALVVGVRQPGSTLEAEQDEVRQLAALFPLVVPLVLDEQPVDARELRKAALNVGAGTTSLLPPRHVDPTAAADALPPSLVTLGSGLRSGLSWSRASREAQIAETLIEHQIQEDISAVEGRRLEKAREPAPETGPSAEARAAFDGLREAVQDQTNRLSRLAQDMARQSTQPGGEILVAIEKAAERLGWEDLVQEDRGKNWRYGIPEGFSVRITESVRTAVKRDFRTLLTTVRDAWNDIGSRLEDLRAAIGGPVSSPELRFPDESDVWAAARPHLRMQVKYSSERPKRNFFHRLGEGRRAMFSLMMLVSMAGMVTGTSFRSRLGTSLGIGMGALLVFGIVRTYGTWRREDEEFAEKEIERARAALVSEAKRAASDSLREIASRLTDEVGQETKALMKAVDTSFKQSMDARRQQSEVERSERQDQQRMLDQAARELSALAKDVGSLRQTVGEVERNVAKLVRDQGRADAAGSSAS